MKGLLPNGGSDDHLKACETVCLLFLFVRKENSNKEILLNIYILLENTKIDFWHNVLIANGRRPIKGSKGEDFSLVYFIWKNKQIVFWTFFSGPDDVIGITPSRDATPQNFQNQHCPTF